MTEPIKPYGDTLNDGITQLSFTLPVEIGARARKAAELYVAKLNFEQITVAHAHKIADNFTYFVVYARAIPTIDYSTIEVSEVVAPTLDFYEINKLIKTKLKRKVIVVGATIGSDAHTVGIDAIMNMKGYNQDYGLERYPEMKAVNMGAQVTCEEILDKAVEMNADALLVSQTVTQKDSHIQKLKELIELLKTKSLKQNYLLVAGGARISNELACEIGYDAGFGPGTLPSHVAAFIVTRLLNKTGAA